MKTASPCTLSMRKGGSGRKASSTPYQYSISCLCINVCSLGTPGSKTGTGEQHMIDTSRLLFRTPVEPRDRNPSILFLSQALPGSQGRTPNKNIENALFLSVTACLGPPCRQSSSNSFLAASPVVNCWLNFRYEQKKNLFSILKRWAKWASPLFLSLPPCQNPPHRAREKEPQEQDWRTS